MTFTRALAALALVLAATSATAAVHRDVTDGTARFAVGTAAGRGPLIASPRVTAFGVGASAATQDAEAVEAVLGLDRSTRRVIQQGLRNEGFDAGTPDGLFGPRTRAAIRDWQTSRGATATGYLNGARGGASSSGRCPAARDVGGSPAGPGFRGRPERFARRFAEPPAPPVPTAVNCEEWNTEAYFEAATAEDVTACLAAGTDVAARDDGGITPLHWAAWNNENPAVLEALLAAGADLEARNDFGNTPLHNAARTNPAGRDRGIARSWREPGGTG